jgi:hypothetical protein
MGNARADRGIPGFAMGRGSLEVSRQPRKVAIGAAAKCSLGSSGEKTLFHTQNQRFVGYSNDYQFPISRFLTRDASPYPYSLQPEPERGANQIL